MATIDDPLPESAAPEDRSTGHWIFGYGSLVDPADLALYLGYAPIKGIDWAPAHLEGFERNWVVGMDNIHTRTDDKVFLDAHGSRFQGVVLSLGIAPLRSQRVNGVVFRTEQRFLPNLDTRERRYDRVDVTGLVTCASDLSISVVCTYVPKPAAVETAAEAIAAGTAAVPRAYHDKVRSAFSQLGDISITEYNASTRDPAAPIADLEVVRQGTASESET